MITFVAQPTGTGALIPWKTGAGMKAAYAALAFVSLLQQQSAMAQARESPPATTNQITAAPRLVNTPKPAANPSDITLEIRCTNAVLKVGDEIPIEFIISNHGTEDYKYVDHNYDRSGRMPEYKLIAKSATDASVPDPRPNLFPLGALGSFAILHPGASFSKIIPLNLWALIKAPGRYEVTATYVGQTYTDPYSARPHAAPIGAGPITITVLPRPHEEMVDYIAGLTNQIAAHLAGQTNQSSGAYDRELEELWMKLMYTCSPEIVPSLLGAWYEVGGNEDFLTQEALLYYVPRTEEVWKAITAAAAKHGLNLNMEGLLQEYDLSHAELKPIIDQALAADNVGGWASGASLAGNSYYDDAFTPRLIAIATDSSAPVNTRGAALDALAQNRSDAGVQTLQKLVNDSGPEIWLRLAMAIRRGYDSQRKTPTGRHLQRADFHAKEMRALTERMLASSKLEDKMYGVSLAEWFGDDALTPQMVALASNSGFAFRNSAIYALALNRTDEGLKTLKAILDDPDPKVSKMAEDAIHYAYTSRHGEQGRPLRPDDFDAKFQQSEPTPAK